MSSLFQFQSYSTATPPQQVLKEVFGYDQFRSLQLDIISSVLSGRDDVIGDLTLVGRPIKGKVTAVKPGHFSNTAFARKVKHTLLY